MPPSHSTVLQLVTSVAPVGLANVSMEVAASLVDDSRKRLAATVTASGDKPVDAALVSLEMGPTSHRVLRLLAERHPNAAMPTLYAGLREVLRTVVGRTRLSSRYLSHLNDPVFWEGFVGSIPPLQVPEQEEAPVGSFTSAQLPITQSSDGEDGVADEASVSEDPYLADWTNVPTPGASGLSPAVQPGADDGRLREELQRFLAGLPTSTPSGAPSTIGEMGGTLSPGLVGMPPGPPAGTLPPVETVVVQPAKQPDVSSASSQAPGGAPMPGVPAGPASPPPAPAPAGPSAASVGRPAGAAGAARAAGPVAQVGWGASLLAVIDLWATSGVVMLAEMVLLVISNWWGPAGAQWVTRLAVAFSWWRVAARWTSVAQAVLGGVLMAGTSAGTYLFSEWQAWWSYLGALTIGVLISLMLQGGAWSWLPLGALWGLLKPPDAPAPSPAVSPATASPPGNVAGILRTPGAARSSATPGGGSGSQTVTFRGGGQALAGSPRGPPQGGAPGGGVGGGLPGLGASPGVGPGAPGIGMNPGPQAGAAMPLGYGPPACGHAAPHGPGAVGPPWAHPPQPFPGGPGGAAAGGCQGGVPSFPFGPPAVGLPGAPLGPGVAAGAFAGPPGWGGGPPGAGGGGGGAGAPMPGPGGDPYSSGRWSGSLPASRRRQAPEIYWQIRASTSTVREWVVLFLPGNRQSQEWADMYGLGESVDLTLHAGYTTGGFPEVVRLLSSDDRVETWLCRLSAEVTYARTGELAMREQLQASRPPGSSDLGPTWAISEARDSAKQLYQQKGRTGGRQGHVASSVGGDGQTGGGRRRMRNRAQKGGSQEGSAASAAAGPPPKK